MPDSVGYGFGIRHIPNLRPLFVGLCSIDIHTCQATCHLSAAVDLFVYRSAIVEHCE